MSAFDSHGAINRLKYAKYFLGKWMHELRHPRPSYSQHDEDRVIGELLGQVKAFIDVGANDGITLSNSYLFSRRGAHGLCFEPVAANFLKARLHHLFHPRIKCIREGLSDAEQATPIFVEGWEGLCSSVETVPGTTLTSSVETIRLRRLEYWVKRFPRFQRADFVSIDVEGHELKVLDGIDFSSLRPRCFIVETDKVPIVKIDAKLSPHGYTASLTNGLNTFWLAENIAGRARLESIAARYSGYRVLPVGSDLAGS